MLRARLASTCVESPRHMEGLVQRLVFGLAMAVAGLLVAWLALTVFEQPLAVSVALGVITFAAAVVLSITAAVRRDVRMLKNHALELTGYEAEINRRVDYLSALVERNGGASPDELAKRMRGLAHEFASLNERLGRLEMERSERPAPAAAAVGAPVEAEVIVARPNGAASVTAKIAPVDPAEPSVAPNTTEASTGMRKVIDARTGRNTLRPPATSLPTGGRNGQSTPDASLDAAKLRRAIAGDALVFHLVPALALPERRPDFYEAIMRLRLPEGGWLEPDALLPLAREHGLHTLIERKTLYCAARMLRSVKAMGKHMRVFAQLSTEALVDDRGFKELRTFLEASSDLNDELILEVSQERFRAMASEARQRLGLVVDAGFSLSMGDMRDPDVDVATLRQLGFRFARAHTTLLLGEPDPAGVDTLAMRLSTHRVALVALGARDEQDVLALIDRDVAHAQGPALSPPRVVKDELLRGPSVPHPQRETSLAS